MIEKLAMIKLRWLLNLNEGCQLLEVETRKAMQPVSPVQQFETSSSAEN